MDSVNHPSLPPGVELMHLSEMKWESSKSGRMQSYLVGHPSQPGLYICAVKWPAHSKALAHKHPDARYGMVLEGVHYIGYGEKYDESKLNRHPAGTWFTEPAEQGHFGLTKDEGTVLLFYGMGPSAFDTLE
ncbi:MAG: cupin domain-containing protein [Betaproteobacteria bacterium]